MQVAFAPGGDRLATVNKGGRTRLWSASTGAMVSDFGGEIRSRVSFSRDGLLLVTTRGSEVDLWDAVSGEHRQTFTTDRRRAPILTRAVFSADGKTVVAAGNQANLYRWAVATVERLSKIRTPARTVPALDCSPSRNLLALSCGDFMIRLWDLTTGTEKVVRTVEDGEQHRAA